MKSSRAPRWFVGLAPVLAALAVASCDDAADGAADSPDSGAVDAADTEVGDIDAGPDVGEVDPADAPGDGAAEPDCDDTPLPIVMVHGFLASGDTWAPQRQRFESNGWCGHRVQAFDWNTLDRNVDHVAALDAFIDEVLASSGAERVDLVGHSAGGGLGYDYLEDPARAARVAHYVHIGSFANDGPAGPVGAPVPTLNIWSPDDLVVEDSGDIEGATNVSIPGADHYAVATGPEAFEAIFRFVTDGAEPRTTAIEPEGRVELSGRVVSLGENRVPVGSTVEVWEVGAEDGRRLTEAPVARFEVGADGAWGPVRGTGAAYYELRVTGPEGSVPVSYYREPQARSNSGVYLRTLPSPGSLAGVLVSVLPFDHDSTVLVVFSASRALQFERDSLRVDGEEVLVAETASPENTTIALFVFDSDRDSESDRTPVGLFSSFPFLAGWDLQLEGDGGSTEVRLGERVIHVSRRPGTEGATIAVFD